MRTWIIAYAICVTCMIGVADEESAARPPVVAHLGIDDIAYDENGKPNGWYQVFNVHFSTNSARYWPEPGKPIDYDVPEESTRGCRLAIKQLAIKIVTERYVPVRNGDHSRRLQFGYSDGEGTSITISGLFLYNAGDDLPQEVQTLLRFVFDVLRAPNNSVENIGASRAESSR